MKNSGSRCYIINGQPSKQDKVPTGLDGFTDRIMI